MIRAALPPGNVNVKSPSIALYVTVKAPGPVYAKLVQETSCCSSLREPDVRANSTKVKPLNRSMVKTEGGENITKTEIFGAFATDEDTVTDEPVIAVEKMAGNDPCELAAITFSKASKIAASTS